MNYSKLTKKQEKTLDIVDSILMIIVWLIASIYFISTLSYPIGQLLTILFGLMVAIKKDSILQLPLYLWYQKQNKNGGKQT